MAADKYVIPTHLDDPELIGLWTLDEFLAMVIPFVWGILSQHILRQAGRRHGFSIWPTGFFRPASPV